MLVLVFNTKKELNDPPSNCNDSFNLSVGKAFLARNIPSIWIWNGETVPDMGRLELHFPKTNCWNLKIPQKGNGETSTQTTFFLVFQAFVFSGGVRCIYIWRSDCNNLNHWAPHRALSSVGIAHNTNWDVTLAQAKLSGLDDGWVFSYQRHL